MLSWHIIIRMNLNNFRQEQDNGHWTCIYQKPPLKFYGAWRIPHIAQCAVPIQREQSICYVYIMVYMYCMYIHVRTIILTWTLILYVWQYSLGQNIN